MNVDDGGNYDYCKTTIFTRRITKEKFSRDLETKESTLRSHLKKGSYIVFYDEYVYILKNCCLILLV